MNLNDYTIELSTTFIEDGNLYQYNWYLINNKYHLWKIMVDCGVEVGDPIFITIHNTYNEAVEYINNIK